MIQRLTGIVLLLFLPLSLSAFAEDDASVYSDILDTSHNIVPKGETPPSPHQICLVCHTLNEVQSYLEPSVKTPPELAAIYERPLSSGGEHARALWNRNADRSDFNAARSGILRKEPASFCLSCHDGVIGSDIHGLKRLNGKFQDHPIDVVYPRESNGHFIPALPLPNELRYWSVPDRNDAGIVLPTGPVSEYFTERSQPVLAVRTSYGKVSCGSCHNPHSSKVSAYLRESPENLCLVCHIR
jgi:predicted CXXCH cytochrome family protein